MTPTSFRRRLCFDLENRPLAYWYDGQTTSEITAFGWKWDDEDEVRTLLLRGGGRFETDDGRRISYRAAYELFVSELRSADLVYGHNIRRHDLPMLHDTLVHRLHLPGLGRLTTTDTFRDLSRGRTLSVSLENLAARYGLPGEKRRMTQPDWENANMLGTGGVAAARERVASDVRLQTQLRERLLAEGLLRPPRVWSP